MERRRRRRFKRICKDFIHFVLDFDDQVFFLFTFLCRKRHTYEAEIAVSFTKLLLSCPDVEESVCLIKVVIHFYFSLRPALKHVMSTGISFPQALGSAQCFRFNFRRASWSFIFWPRRVCSLFPKPWRALSFFLRTASIRVQMDKKYIHS